MQQRKSRTAEAPPPIRSAAANLRQTRAALLRGATRCYAPFKQLVMASQSAFHKWAVPNLIRFGKGEVDLHPTHF